MSQTWYAHTHEQNNNQIKIYTKYTSKYYVATKTYHYNQVYSFLRFVVSQKYENWTNVPVLFTFALFRHVRSIVKCFIPCGC